MGGDTFTVAAYVCNLFGQAIPSAYTRTGRELSGSPEDVGELGTG